jgi:hypothetical protein
MSKFADVAVQDSLMDVLAASAQRQKEIARTIAGELKEQDDILDDFEDEVDDAEQVIFVFKAFDVILR